MSHIRRYLINLWLKLQDVRPSKITVWQNLNDIVEMWVTVHAYTYLCILSLCASIQYWLLP